jgi:hypothetical protein
MLSPLGRNCPLASISWRGPENVNLSVHFLISLRGIVLNYFSIRIAPSLPVSFSIFRSSSYRSCYKVRDTDEKYYPSNRPWRPIDVRDAEDPTLSRQSAQTWRYGCQPYAPVALYSPEILLFCFWYSFLLDAE